MIVTALFLSIGCTSMPKMPPASAFLPPGPASRVIAVWEPALRHTGSDAKPERGFGARVYFYDANERKPIKIDGSVVVYAFDEDGRKAGDNEPDRSYYFVKDDMKKVYSKSKLGHSYSLWVPWDCEGPNGEAKKVSLIVRYVPEKGSSVASKQTALNLPGKAKNEMLAQSQGVVNHSVQQVSYIGETPVANEPRPKSLVDERIIETPNWSGGMHTTTIDMLRR